MHQSRVAALFTTAALTLTLAACGSADADAWSAPRPDPAPVGTLGPGFIDLASPPPPEGSLVPAAGSWDAVSPSDGYRVALLVGGDDAPTNTTADAVLQWAEVQGLHLKTVRVTDPDEFVGGIVEAMDLEPDLVVSVGSALVDPLALVTPNHLDQQFLVIGAQVPEHTFNVTAAVWTGASSRGAEVDDLDSSYDPAAYTPERADAAVRAGVASVLNEITGIVIWLA